MFRFKINTLIIHLTGWLLFLLMPVLFLNSGNKTGSAWVLLSSPFYWLFCLTYLFLFYFNILFLIPAFFLTKKYWLYSLLVLIMAGLVFFLQPFDKLLANNPRFRAQMAAAAKDSTSTNAVQNATGQTMARAMGADTNKRLFGPLPNASMHMQDPAIKKPSGNALWQHSANVDIVSLVLFIMIVALGISVTTIEQWHTTEQKVVKAEAEKVNAELSFLKAQINPHFLFNTLNNIYTLSVINSQHTSESIMKLSNIMRYVTDDVTKDFVPLSYELNCIRDYIDLQRLRLGKKTTVDFEIIGAITNQHIAPLILMSFIENTFKYGISKQESSTIKIEINIRSELTSLYCENRIFNRTTSERTGIGIANTRRRLEHLYPNRHELNIEERDGLFCVTLILNN